MDRTLLGLANIVYNDVDEKTPTDSAILANIKTYVQRAYKEVAKREGLEKSTTVTVVGGKFLKPDDFYKVIDLEESNGDFVPWEEEENYIVVDDDYEGYILTLYYNYIPPNLTDGQEPLTNPNNDEAIISQAKYLYYRKEGKENKGELDKRDFETFPIKRPKKTMQFKVYR